MVMLLVSIAERVRALRDAHDPPLSQSELALAVGVEKSYIGSLEQGRIKLPSPDILIPLARALDTSVAELLNAAGYLPNQEMQSLNDNIDDPRLRLWLRRAAEVKDPGHQRVLIGVIREITEIEEEEGVE